VEVERQLVVSWGIGAGIASIWGAKVKSRRMRNFMIVCFQWFSCSSGKGRVDGAIKEEDISSEEK